MADKKSFSIFEEAKLFHIKVWETPSFLFTLLGLFTILLIALTYFMASKSLEPEIVIISISVTAGLSLLIGGMVVKGISKIIIIDRAKSEFISLASHQLRTPLTGIKWVLNLILSGTYGHVDSKVKKKLQEGYASNERMIILVDDLLSVSRIETDRFIYEYFPLRLENLVNSVLANLKHQLKENDIKINLTKYKESVLPDIKGDERKLKFVLQNILDNAIKYSPQHSMITISYKIKAGVIVCGISDRGMGIPHDQQEKIFDKFFRAENAIRHNISGSGLGLYIAKNIIEHHSGKILVRSKESKGTTVSFTLPIFQG